MIVIILLIISYFTYDSPPSDAYLGLIYIYPLILLCLCFARYYITKNTDFLLVFRLQDILYIFSIVSPIFFTSSHDKVMQLGHWFSFISIFLVIISTITIYIILD